jgi:hypothetical protein
MLCVQILRPHLNKGARVPEIEDFMLRKPTKKTGFGSFVAMLDRKAGKPRARK